MIGLYPGIQVGWGEENDDQRLDAIWLGEEPTDLWAAGHRRFAELDEVTASEVLTDLEVITAASS